MNGSLTPFAQRTLAFSAICHAAAVVDDLAHGRISTPPRYLVEGIFTQGQADLAEVFSPVSNFRTGIGIAADLLSGRLRSPQQARYVAQLMKLATLLKRDQAMVGRLRSLLDQALAGEIGSRVAADIYRETISKLGTRIQVTGAADVLQQTACAENIRAVLLAGIRFAWAWYQLGGRQWQLVFQRGAMRKVLGELAVS